MDLVTGAMGMLPSKLLELLGREYKLQKGVRADIKFLSRELDSMYAALRKVATVPWEQLDDQIKIWASDVREASYDMEDVIDTFIICVNRGTEPSDTDNMVKRLLKKMGRLFNLSKVKARRDIAGAIEGIKKQLQEMSERRDRYRVDDIVAPPSATIDPRLPAFYKQASQLVGIDEPRDELIKMLSIGDCAVPDDKEMKIISVVGFGGLGKTTLAKAVYDKVNLKFGCRAFVSVGQNPDPIKVLRDILIDIEKNRKTSMIFDPDKRRSTVVDLMELDAMQLINKLREYLEGKMYLIVVDDIWETSTWEIVKCAFVDGNCGSRIITTTRISHVSKEIGEVYKMAKLSDMNSKKLFYRTTFGGEEKRPCSAELDEVSDKFIRKCHGVPLAIVTIASVLANKPLEEWSTVYTSIGFGPDGDEKVENMKKILSFSYYYLPCYLRTCLLYLSILPEEFTIEKRELILRWIAEGFVQEEKGKDYFEIGDNYVRELINRNMVIPIEEKGSGLLIGCRVHDMVLHLIRDMSSKENFMVVLAGEQQPPAQDTNIRRLAIQMSEVKTSNYKDMPQVRSFNAIICGARLMPPLCSFNVLRVLVLELCIGMEDYPAEHITKLLHLRYLGLSHTPVLKLPKEIGCLKCLQTLLLDDTGIEELPLSVRQLTQLMCLRVDKKMSVPKWIGKLTSLVELDMYHEVPEWSSVVGPGIYRGVPNKCSTSQFVKELGKLTNLRVLKTGINLQDEGQGRDFLESLSKLSKIQAIDISLPSAFLPMDLATMEPEFALSSSLRVLDLYNLEFSRVPAWINDERLPNLCQLAVLTRTSSSREDEQDLAVLGKLRGLRKLVLVFVAVYRLDLAVCGSDGFQNLISLEVTAPLKFAHGAMPRLEYIKFSIPVVELKDAGIDLEFGLENLSSLRSVSATIHCADACSMEVDEAEDVLNRAIDIHPNHPAREVTKMNEDKIGPADAFSRTWNRTNYKILKAVEVARYHGADIIVQQDLYNQLYNELAEVARSMPSNHPCVAKLALLPKQLAGDPVRTIGDAFELLDLDQLMEKIEAQERLLEEYNVEIPRLAAIVEEMKTAAQDGEGVGEISDHVAEAISMCAEGPMADKK